MKPKGSPTNAATNKKGEASALNSADPIRNFTLSMDERIRAITIGVPAWAARKRKIEDDVERFVGQLVDLHDTLVEKKAPASEIELSMIAAATALDLEKLNTLITKHNKYYPIEANLALNRHSEYVVYGRVWKPEEPYTIARFVALATNMIGRRDEEQREQQELQQAEDP